MLTIRREQLETLGDESASAFRHSLLAWLMDEYPERYGSPPHADADALVDRAMESAPALGIASRGALAGYVALLAEYGERFERTPDGSWARQILGHPTLPGELKISLIARRLDARTQGRRIVRVNAPE